jgi:hypothetical protein
VFFGLVFHAMRTRPGWRGRLAELPDNSERPQASK